MCGIMTPANIQRGMKWAAPTHLPVTLMFLTLQKIDSISLAGKYQYKKSMQNNTNVCKKT